MSAVGGVSGLIMLALSLAARDPQRSLWVILHSPLMFAALMIGHHFSISAF
jgi:hypothetical protein